VAGSVQPAGSFYGWRRGWPLPPLVTRPDGDLTVEETPPDGPLADISADQVARRLADRNRVFLLRLGGELAAYGWSAAGRAHIGGLDLAFVVPPGERYLWDFVTFPPYRGRGLYPLLLQEILRRESSEAEWFWIGHDAENLASRRGILKAGFAPAGEAGWAPDGQLGLVRAAEADPELVRRASRLLGLPLIDAR
jgi:hypothetical protein